MCLLLKRKEFLVSKKIFMSEGLKNLEVHQTNGTEPSIEAQEKAKLKAARINNLRKALFWGKAWQTEGGGGPTSALDYDNKSSSRGGGGVFIRSVLPGEQFIALMNAESISEIVELLRFSSYPEITVGLIGYVDPDFEHERLGKVDWVAKDVFSSQRDFYEKWRKLKASNEGPDLAQASQLAMHVLTRGYGTYYDDPAKLKALKELIKEFYDHERARCPKCGSKEKLELNEIPNVFSRCKSCHKNIDTANSAELNQCQQKINYDEENAAIEKLRQLRKIERGE